MNLSSIVGRGDSRGRRKGRERKRKKNKGDGAGLGRGPGETGDMPRRSREDAGGRAGEGLGKRTKELDRARDGPGRG